MHARSLVHRDLKPTNVLLAADGPRVIDFGISRAMEGTAVTASNVIVGTPGFMSPEQSQGLPVGFSSDVFALGSVIAFAVTGTPPFGSGDLVATAYRIVHAQPDLSGMPTSLRNLVASCLAKAPAGRPSLTRLLDAIMAQSAFYPSVSPANFWPEPVAGLISSRQDSFRTQVAPHVGSGPVAVMPSLPHKLTAPARAGSGEDGEETTRTAARLSGIRSDPLIGRPEPPARESISGKPGSLRDQKPPDPAKLAQLARQVSREPSVLMPHMKWSIAGIIVGLILLFIVWWPIALAVIVLAIALPSVAWLMLDESQRQRYGELRRRQRGQIR